MNGKTSEGCLRISVQKTLVLYILSGVKINKNYISVAVGLMTGISGILGISLGPLLSKWMQNRASNSEPLVSAFGLLSAAVLIYVTLVVVQSHILVAWPLILLGEVAVLLNRALIPKILVDCVVPHRRALASGSNYYPRQ